MDEKEQQGLKKQRERRKRVQRIRTGIITFITVWIILSIILISFLFVKILAMQKQLDILTGKYDSSERVTGDVNQSAGEDSLLLSQAEMNKDNLAEEGDILKVYLTFDDGPSENSNEILDILDDYGVKATFFVTGKEDEESKAVYRRIVDEGHTIAMHSYSHKYSEIYSSLDAFKADYEKIQNLIYDTTGVECHYYRFPGGSSNQVSNVAMAQYIKYINDQDVTYFDWNISSGDATAQAFTSDELVENVMQDVVQYKTSVVLMHDASNKDATVQALPKLIESLRGVGAVILPIDDDTTVIQHTSVQQ